MTQPFVRQEKNKSREMRQLGKTLNNLSSTLCNFAFLLFSFLFLVSEYEILIWCRKALPIAIAVAAVALAGLYFYLNSAF